MTEDTKQSERKYKNYIEDFDYDQFFVDETKLSECKYELVFNITASLLEQDDSGNTKTTNNLYAQNYHIPIPDDKNHKTFLDTFFKYLENQISTTAQQTYNPKESENE